MTKPPIPDNPITDVLNSGTFDWSLLAMMLITFGIAGVYIAGAAFLRRGAPKSMDLAFSLAIASPLSCLIVLGAMGWGLVTGACALIVGILLGGGFRAANPAKPNRAPQRESVRLNHGFPLSEESEAGPASAGPALFNPQTPGTFPMGQDIRRRPTTPPGNRSFSAGTTHWGMRNHLRQAQEPTALGSC